MKKIVSICIGAIICCSTAESACFKVQCASNAADNPAKSAKEKLEKAYEKVNKELKNVKSEYDELLKNLKKSNENLDVAIQASKNKLLKEKEILFLLEQHNQLQGVENNIGASE